MQHSEVVGFFPLQSLKHLIWDTRSFVVKVSEWHGQERSKETLEVDSFFPYISFKNLNFWSSSKIAGLISFHTMKIQNVHTKSTNFITPGAGGGKIKVILLTGQLSYILKKKPKPNKTKIWILPSSVEICNEEPIKAPLQRSLLWPGFLHPGIPGAKTAVPSFSDVACGSICPIL